MKRYLPATSCRRRCASSRPSRPINVAAIPDGPLVAVSTRTPTPPPIMRSRPPRVGSSRCKDSTSACSRPISTVRCITRSSHASSFVPASASGPSSSMHIAGGGSTSTASSTVVKSLDRDGFRPGSEVPASGERVRGTRSVPLQSHARHERLNRSERCDVRGRTGLA